MRGGEESAAPPAASLLHGPASIPLTIDSQRCSHPIHSPLLLGLLKKKSRFPGLSLGRCGNNSAHLSGAGSYWPLPLSPSSRQPLRHWSSLPNAPCACSNSYSWSRKSRLLLLGRPRMVNLWDTLVHCSRLAATLSYSSVASGNSSDSSLEKDRKSKTGLYPTLPPGENNAQ